MRNSSTGSMRGRTATSFVSEIAQLLATDSEVEVLPQGVRAVVSQRLGLLNEKCRELPRPGVRGRP